MTGDRLRVAVVMSVDERLPSTRPMLRALEQVGWDVVVHHPATRRPAPTLLPTGVLPPGAVALPALWWDRGVDGPAAVDLVVVVLDGDPVEPAVAAAVRQGPVLAVVGTAAPAAARRAVGPLTVVVVDEAAEDLPGRLRAAATAAIAVEPLARGLDQLARRLGRVGLAVRPAVARAVAQGVVDLFDPPEQNLHGGILAGRPPLPEEAAR